MCAKDISSFSLGRGWWLDARSCFCQPICFRGKNEVTPRVFLQHTPQKPLFDTLSPCSCSVRPFSRSTRENDKQAVFFFSFVLLPASHTVGLSCSTHLEMDSFLCFFLLFHCAVVLLSLLCSPLFPLVPCFFFFSSCVCFVYRFLELAFFFLLI